MPVHGAGEHRLRRVIERGRRLVEQPQRALGQQEAHEAGPPPLPGGEISGGDVTQGCQIEGLQRRVEAFGAVARATQRLGAGAQLDAVIRAGLQELAR